MADKLRSVKIKKTPSSSYDINGKFHGWGTKTHPLDNGLDLQVTVGIIELEDGKIDLFEPRNIHFID